MKKSFTTFFFILFSSLFFNVSAQIIYVDSSATGANNGVDWDSAYVDLQSALAAVPSNGQIWVAQGTYTPDSINGDPAATFLIDSDVLLLGGFSGIETDTSQRDPVLNLTILSGDLNGDDIPNDFGANKADNVWHVLKTTIDITAETLIDGFTIQYGYADGTPNANDQRGAGLLISGGPIISNCFFTQNYAERSGGGINVFGFSGLETLIEDCRFENNQANTGGGLNMGSANFIIRNCAFQSNSSHAYLNIEPHGGGIFVFNSNGTVQNSLFKDNSAAQAGGGVFAWSNSSSNGASVDLIDCTFENNSADPSSAGGGAYFGPWGNNTSYTVMGCIFIENEARQGGGLGFQSNENSNNASLFVDNCVFESNNTSYGGSALTTIFSGTNSEFMLRNCQFIENTAQLACGAVDLWGGQEGTGNVVVDSCFFDGNVSYYNGGLNMNVGEACKLDFTLTNSIFTNNEATEGGAMGMWCDPNDLNEISLLLDNCVFDGNEGTVRGGAITFSPESNNFHAVISRTKIINNVSPIGGAFDSYLFFPTATIPDSASIHFENCLIANNTSDNAAISLDSMGNFSMINCTVANNPSNGIEISGGTSLTLQNTILYNPGYTEYEAVTNDVNVTSSGGNLFGDNSLADYALSSDLQEENPLFDLSGTTHCDSFQLSEDSPAIDKGIEWIDTLDLDLCGNERIHNSVIDIGAIESPYSVSVKDIITGELEISPNPTMDFLNFPLPENITQPIDISIFDIQGRLMNQQYFSSGETIDVGDIPPGLYLLKAVDDKKIYTGKFVKQ